ncbi:dual specificity protein phosphatase 13 isoform X1 [Leptonychotes weddellii]|uniref:Dual specificity protein phosphatase 13B n=2 Tax=Leptonychotes weddellii TaxID=9713 RepID=A0A7F8QTJ7_LEPWE|nr:dual specificity protein phosphatase 13 isoform X1 [Leptonychotes weddellii]
MVRSQCVVRPRACYPISFLLLPALRVGYCLQSPQILPALTCPCFAPPLKVKGALKMASRIFLLSAPQSTFAYTQTTSRPLRAASTPGKARCLAGLGTDHARDQWKQHQVCGDRELEADSTKCPSEKTTAWARYPHRMDSLQKQDLRRPKIHGAVRGSPYQPPTLAYLQRLLWVRRAAMLSHVNEVWPNLFLGDAYAARDKSKLTQLGITHVVNVAAGKFQVDTGARFYRGMPLEYYGIEADDNPFFDLSVYFLPVAQYIRTALSVPQGRVLVHCAMGVSRSATVVLAFLMICENMTLVEAIQTVQAHRDICPNSGFLRQLQVLDNRLGRETGRL